MAHYQIEDLTFSYPGKQESLKNIHLTIEKGEYVVLCGQSGSGKTTLLRHLKSVLTPYGSRNGKILFCDVPLEDVSFQQQAGRIGFVMQNPDDQIVTDKVWHELSFGLENLGYDQKTIRARVSEMACYFGIQDWFDRDVANLSGGQKQLLNLASVMAMQPEVLILDEPTSQLDPIAASDFLNTVRKINLELGTTVIITEHRLEDIFPAADRVVILEKGSVLVNDSPRNVGNDLWQMQNPMFSAMPTPVRVFYMANGQGACPLTVREGRTWLSNTCTAAIRQNPEKPAQPATAVALELKDIWFRYEKDSPDILKGVSAKIPQGSLYAIVGGNGAGKSTALKAICGICKPYRGSLKLFGKDSRSYKGGSLFRSCVAMLPQDPKSLFVKNTLQEDLQEMDASEEEILETAALCNVQNLLQSHPYDLSGGELQRAALAKVLLTKPRLLLLDEPTKGIDSFYKAELAKLLQNLQKQGVTILMVSHDVEFCAQYADMVSMFFDGQILTTNIPERFFGDNSFYTTAANRMSRCVFKNAVTAETVAQLYRKNQEERP